MNGDNNIKPVFRLECIRRNGHYVRMQHRSSGLTEYILRYAVVLNASVGAHTVAFIL